MDGQEGTVKFKAADAFFEQGNFQEALRLLNELDVAYPNNTNILYPKALCLEKLGQWDDAERICDWLIQQGTPCGKVSPPRAQALKTQIQTAKAAASGGLDLTGLDTDLLAGILEPVPKRTAPPPVATSPDTRRYLVIGGVALLVVAVALLGVKKGWFGARAESIETVEAKLVDLWGKIDSHSAVLDVTADIKQGPMPTSMHGTASVDFMKKDGKALYRFEGTNSMKSGGPQSMDMTIMLVSDGNDMYGEIGMTGMPVVVKMKTPSPAQAPADVGKLLFAQLHEAFDIKLLQGEMPDGAKAYMFQLTPKEGGAAKSRMPRIGALQICVTRDRVAQLTIVLSDTSGAPFVTLALKDIRPNPDLTEARFKYTPPAGVKPMEWSDLQKMMPMLPKL